MLHHAGQVSRCYLTVCHHMPVSDGIKHMCLGGGRGFVQTAVDIAPADTETRPPCNLRNRIVEAHKIASTLR